jgi:hypothetical protein
VTVAPGDRLVDNTAHTVRRGTVQKVAGTRVTVRWARGNETVIQAAHIHEQARATGYTIVSRAEPT